MGKVLKMLLISLLLISILSLPIALGCNGDKADTSGELSQLELEQILTDSITAINQVNTYGMNADMGIFMDIRGGGEEGTMDMDMTMEGYIDQTSMDMYMLMDLYLAMDIGFEAGSEDMTIDMYMVDDYLYMKMDIPELGEEWIKMPATDETMSAYDLDMVSEQLAILESPGELNYLRDEILDGSDCYVIQMIPDLAAIMDWIGDQGLADLGLDWEDVGVIRDMFDELTYTIWIDKETKYIKKMTAYILMKMSGDDFADMDGDIGTITMDMNMDIEMYDYNKPVTIVLPDEALDAMEFGDFGF